MRTTDGPQFAKGHGTENDFVVLPDPDGELKLTGARVRALCHRQRGLGADGVLRVVRAGALEEAGDVPPETWFMDYRNADGSLAEMCGNGVRVFARYLVEAGHVAPGEFTVGTRSGPRRVVTHPGGDVTVEMGPAAVFAESWATVGDQRFAGLAVDVGNPHLACVGDLDLDALDLTAAPEHDPAVFPQGVNVEFVRPLDRDRVRMRVHERGVGETRSCGTGTVAAAAAALRVGGAGTGTREVQVPGGVVRVEITAGTSTLTGPAVLAAHGRVEDSWWQAAEFD